MLDSADLLPLCESKDLILFHSTLRSQLSRLAEDGATEVELHGRIPQIDGNCVLAVRTSALDSLRFISNGLWQADYVPLDAFLNINPYLEPREITAAGGLILRAGVDAMELLLIHRNGAWDLPKGKLDPGETLATCARREVEEETGAVLLQAGPLLATTTHGYERNNEFKVKTSYWFAFQSRSKSFVPQTMEGITRVAWVPWNDAENCLGYASLRNLLRRVRKVMENWSEPGGSRV